MGCDVIKHGQPYIFSLKKYCDDGMVSLRQRLSLEGNGFHNNTSMTTTNIQKIMNIERLVATNSAASVLSFTLTFSPSSAVDTRAARMFLGDRNYNDPRFYDINGKRMAMVVPKVSSAAPIRNKVAVARKINPLDLYTRR